MSDDKPISITDYFTRPCPETVAELRKIPNAFPQDFNDAVAESFLEWCRQYNVEISTTICEAFTAHFTQDDIYAFYAKPEVLRRFARSTGLWLPGNITFQGSGYNMQATATSLMRHSTIADSWYEGASATATFMQYYVRQPNTSQPINHWLVNPVGHLSVTAECLSIYKALGDHVAQLRVAEVRPGSNNDLNYAALINGQISLQDYKKKQGRNE